MSKEAMQMALEALEGNCTNPAADPEQAATEDAAITALRQALETEKQWVGLTDEEIAYQARKEDYAVYFALGALWAEAKLKERNHG